LKPAIFALAVALIFMASISAFNASINTSPLLLIFTVLFPESMLFSKARDPTFLPVSVSTFINISSKYMSNVFGLYASTIPVMFIFSCVISSKSI